jgi:hypothetical protein
LFAIFLRARSSIDDRISWTKAERSDFRTHRQPLRKTRLMRILSHEHSMNDESLSPGPNKLAPGDMRLSASGLLAVLTTWLTRTILICTSINSRQRSSRVMGSLRPSSSSRRCSARSTLGNVFCLRCICLKCTVVPLRALASVGAYHKMTPLLTGGMNLQAPLESAGFRSTSGSGRNRTS